MTLLSECYCAQGSWLAGLVLRVIGPADHMGVKRHGKGQSKVRRLGRGCKARVKRVGFFLCCLNGLGLGASKGRGR